MTATEKRRIYNAEEYAKVVLSRDMCKEELYDCRELITVMSIALQQWDSPIAYKALERYKRHSDEFE